MKYSIILSSCIALLATPGHTQASGDYPRDYPRSDGGQNYVIPHSYEMLACNPDTDKTNVRRGPSAKSYDKVSELLNGQDVTVIDRITNPDGYDYYEIVYTDEVGAGQLYDFVGYVYHEALAERCDADFNEVMARNETWPQSASWWGCDFLIADKETADYWLEISAKLPYGGMSGAEKELCKQVAGGKVAINRYLGYYEPDGRDHFQIAMNGCNAQFSIKSQDDGVTYDYGWRYDQSCLDDLAKANAPKVSNSPQFGIGDAFSLVFGAGIHGLAAISGTTASEIMSSVADDDVFCYNIEDDDAKYACLNKPFQTNNPASRDILLGQCFGLDDQHNSSGLREVCAGQTSQSCHSLNNSDDAFACTTCGGSRQWAAVYAAGTILTCYRS